MGACCSVVVEGCKRHNKLNPKPQTFHTWTSALISAFPETPSLLMGPQAEAPKSGTLQKCPPFNMSILVYYKRGEFLNMGERGGGGGFHVRGGDYKFLYLFPHFEGSGLSNLPQDCCFRVLGLGCRVLYLGLWFRKRV